jgi:imidazoleglycerol phosphate synthase glutamine amidotransferase subunit HisH
MLVRAVKLAAKEDVYKAIAEAAWARITASAIAYDTMVKYSPDAKTEQDAAALEILEAAINLDYVKPKTPINIGKYMALLESRAKELKGTLRVMGPYKGNVKTNMKEVNKLDYNVYLKAITEVQQIFMSAYYDGVQITIDHLQEITDINTLQYAYNALAVYKDTQTKKVPVWLATIKKAKQNVYKNIGQR